MRKNFARFILPVLLLAPAFASCAVAQETAPTSSAAHTEYIGDQIEASTAMTPSEEVSYVEESELTRKMIQAKKAEDAKTYDSYGGGITIISMCIVLSALIVLSILFYFFGSISSWFITRTKKKVAVAKGNGSGDSINVNHEPDSADTIAAIAAALAQHFATDHDMQDTILTIRRMRKAYSPWNSKIYNMRHQPELTHQLRRPGQKL